MSRKCVIDIETESLDPKEGRIICIGIKDVECQSAEVFYDDDEIEMLRRFLEYFHGKKFDQIIGYNILFDLRYIFARCLKYRIYSNGFFRSLHVDLMLIMKSVKNVFSMNKPGTLEEWSQFLFGESKLETAESVPVLFTKGEIQRIIDYNRKDLELTYQLWKRIQEVLSDGN
jgi:DNA polymerase elongation subunit (family B)